MTESATPSPGTPAADMEKIIERGQKMLALARRGGSEAEMATAMAMFQKLLAEHNLDMATVESAQAGSAKREKAAQAGGQYAYQRDLWKAVAELNFCIYMTGHVRVEVNKRLPGGGSFKSHIWRREHRVVGRTVNTRASIVMATYLEETANRLCRERLTTRSGAGVTPGELNSQFYSSWAVSFRVGVADRIIEKVQERRAAHLREENRKRRKAEREAAGGTSTATALSLSVFKSAEEDANIDFLHGEGTAAQWAAARAEQAAERAQDRADYTAWAKANPDKAKQDRHYRKWWQDRGYTFGRVGRGASTETTRGPGYFSGYEAGEGVSIDPQAGSANTKRIGGG